MSRVDSRIKVIKEDAAVLKEIDPEVAAAWPDDQVSEAISASDIPVGKLLETIFTAYADRPAFGMRDYEIVSDPASGKSIKSYLPSFSTLSYAEIWEKIMALVAGWANLGVRPGDFIATLGFTSAEYFIIDLAASYLGLVTVPLQTSSSVAQIAPILTETEPKLFAVSAEYMDDAIAAIAGISSLKYFLVFDYIAGISHNVPDINSVQVTLKENFPQIKFLELNEFIAESISLEKQDYFIPPAGEDPYLRLIYTSGSTGTPKGAIYTFAHTRRLMQRTMGIPNISLHYMPLSHLYGIMWMYFALNSGGVSYFTASSDNSSLLQDLSLTRPTMLNLVPRVCDMFYQQYEGTVESLKTSDKTEKDQAEKDLAEQVREQFLTETLGGRVLFAMTGTAPTSPNMQNFMEFLLGSAPLDTYGSTEAGTIVMDGYVEKSLVLDYKLVDVPELGYFVSDQPYPRGELYLKTVNLIPGYFKRPDLNATIFDEDGFYKTGDVMALVGPDRLVYVDRSSNVMKLSQGEFVTLAKIEAVFSTCPVVKQIFVYGKSSEAFLLAVVVPSDDLLTSLKSGESPEALKPVIMDAIQKVAKENNLNGYEIPRDILIEKVPFTRENGLLSGIGKVLRPALKRHYGERLDALYADIASAKIAELKALKDTVASASVLEVVTRAVAISLGGADTVDAQANFADLGGDSLSAFSLSQLLEEIFQVEVPVRVIIGPTASLQSIADFIETERSGESTRPTVASVHGKNVDTFYAKDLTLEKFIDPVTLAAAHHLESLTTVSKTILLTGANGYLGRFLALNWLERIAPLGGKVICIGRGKDPASAWQRIIDTLDTDPALKAHFTELAEEHLEMLVGDLGEVHLGLKDTEWNDLASQVDHIVHNGALVNHVLPYSQLFGPNTLGTAELIRLALTTKLKSITFMSTIAVAASGDNTVIDEDSDIRKVNTQRSALEGYAGGYASSKWASEVLLREAHEQFGVPVTVFRSDMILIHEKYQGQLNPTDMFTRLILSLVATGLAPESFYEQASSKEHARAHYEGLPVNFTAEAVTTLGGDLRDGYYTFNLINAHEDGISLDTFVDWLIESGIKIEKIANFAEWNTRFTTALKQLPEKQKHDSILPLMHAYAAPAYPIDGSPIPTDKFVTAVQKAGIGTDKDVPHLNKTLINKYVSDLETLGFFK